MMDKLREEAQTGYPDLEEIALDLVQVTETAWLRQLSTWVLYGRLPAFGAEDFMIALVDEGDQGVDSGTPEYAIVAGLMPKLVTSSAASSILFVGRSLNHIRAQGNTLSSLDQSSFTSPELALLPAHLRHLSALSSPISSSSLSSAISAIRASLSKNMLQQLLPLPKILDILSVLRDYFLLERGEFAIALITEADEHLKARWRRPEHASQDQASDKLTAVLIKEGEVTAVLARTWATLSSFHAGDDEDDDADDLARDLIDLSISKSPTRAPPTPARSSSDEHYALADVQFNDLLLSTPTTLSLYVSSPLDLFITPRDLDSYTAIHSYLLSIRRGHLKLTHLWKRTTLRRDHPSPLGPPHSNTSTGQASLQQRRARANARARGMRKVWATSSAAAFLLAEVGEYFQGQVVKGSWKTFLSWLDTSVRTDEEAGTRHETAQNRDRNHDDDVGDEVDLWTGRKASSSDPRQAPSAPDRTPHDPETLSRAHRLYLSSLTHALFLTDLAFTSALRAFLRSLDHLVACVARVDAAQKTLDLETDSGVVDTDVDGAVEERRAMRALLGADEAVHADLGTLLGRLRELDGERSVGSSGGAAHGVGEFDGFVPWRSGGVDRLCMKLDFGSFVGG
ncbi:MAG: hypothetical protein M1832_005493 [Thelocarpon impressellum]|nr:MAG: hypothetical protein M1832_005493 [Thelocarpon impressellum]